MSGNPNAVNYLGVKGYNDRNSDRRNLFGSNETISTSQQVLGEYPHVQPQESLPYTLYDPQVFYGQQSPSNNQFLLDRINEMENVINSYKEAELVQREQQKRLEEQQEKRAGIGLMLSLLNEGNSTKDNSYMSILDLLSNNKPFI